MFVAASPSEPATVPLSGSGGVLASIARVRVDGGLRATFRVRDGLTALATLAETDGYRMRCPRTGTGCEGVMINTGGGVAGGDTVTFDMASGPGADVLLTTPSADRVYRALPGPSANIAIRLSVANAARLVWWPQETILYDGARLRRTLAADVAPTGHLLAAECTVFGRTAHGEAVTNGLFRETWRITRGGRLVFADDTRLEVDIASRLAAPTTAAAAHATALIVFVSPDAEDQLDAVRAKFASSKLSGCRIAATTFDGVLLVRAVATDAGALRAVLAGIATFLSRRPASRLWQVADV